MSPDHISPIDSARAEQMARLRELGPVIASTAAARLFLYKIPIKEALKVKTDMLERFSDPSFHRSDYLRAVSEQLELCHAMCNQLNPGLDTRTISYQTRRLELIQMIVTNNIADGQNAVTTADLLLGRFVLSPDALNLVTKSSTR